MAQRIQVILEDDIDGGAAAETVTFALDGVTYEIDLSEDNARKLRDDLATWVGHARRSGGRKTTGRKPSSGGGRNNLNDVREWGRQNGFQVSDRGRVSSELQKAYDAAH
ncbi:MULTISPECIES: histone-like nucleoid-structuring protein Lsr2 [Arsenicicoccus]|uniref:Lsr2 family protein n=2 Tax=Arsenicicoccus bolidensis TaxID=229480 RepID=A0ABS9PZ61_9MICO|nr:MULTISPECIES: Lsr2 family protein [Arsenicicoccus]MCG7320899.1 Lsr2 family protein [Arsenicicoccus bolidensis]